MKVNGKHYRTIWLDEKNPNIVRIIDQRKLPHIFGIVGLHKVEDFQRAIKEMYVRGAPLIGATAAYGIYIATLNAPHNNNAGFNDYIKQAASKLLNTRPTAVNLAWAVEKQLNNIFKADNRNNKIQAALDGANQIADDDAEQCASIGKFGAKLIKRISEEKNGDTVNILTHCNAGWLATVDYGTAIAPIYEAAKQGVKLHVWVDETRPRNQGAKLTAWELGQNDIPHTLIVDNAGGHLMQRGLVDMCIVGSDRTSYTGDVANKIGTYLKALAAKDCGVPFYVALPSSTIDWKLEDGVKEIPIEQRGGEEVRYVDGLYNGEIVNVLVPSESTPVANYAFDVTPRQLVTALITERGVCRADKQDIIRLFPEHNNLSL